MKKVLIVCLLGCSWLTACGQKGPLYLPPEQNSQEPVDQSAEVSSLQSAGAGLAGALVALS